jgi:hypothetical protein
VKDRGSVDTYTRSFRKIKRRASKLLEHFHRSRSDEQVFNRRPFDFWLPPSPKATARQVRFGSVTGFSNLLLHRSLAKNKKSSLLIATASLSMLSKIISTIV